MLTEREIYQRGRMDVALPPNAVRIGGKPGILTLALDRRRDALLFVPPTYLPEQPMPFVLLLHGAGGTARHGLDLLLAQAEAEGLILLSVASQNNSWDIISTDGFGPDVMYINSILDEVFSEYSVDRKRIGIGGFSDGASYALCLGLTNGDLFTHILAFSPGFVYTMEENGMPQVYISHGTNDHILPIDPCSRKVVPRLKKKGYGVTYTEFDGEHVIPEEIRREAVSWFTS